MVEVAQSDDNWPLISPADFIMAPRNYTKIVGLTGHLLR